MDMATKLGTVTTYNEELPPKKLHDLSITPSGKVM